MTKYEMQRLIEASLVIAPLKASAFTAWWYNEFLPDREEEVGDGLAVLNRTLATAYLISKWGGEGIETLDEFQTIALSKYISEHQQEFLPEEGWNQYVRDVHDRIDS